MVSHSVARDLPLLTLYHMESIVLNLERLDSAHI